MSVEQNVTRVARSAMRTSDTPLLTVEQAVDIADDFARRLQHADDELAAIERDLAWLPVKRRARGQRDYVLLTAQVARDRIAACLRRHGYERPGR